MDGELVNRNEVTHPASNEAAPEEGRAVIFDKPDTDLPAPDSAPALDSVPRALLQHMPPLYYADREGRFVFRNAAFDAIAQSAFPEFQSRERREQPQSPVPRELQEIFDRLNGGGEQVKLRQSLTVDGETRHFRSCHSKVVEDGQTVGYCGIYTNVTLEAEAVIQAARTETRFQDIIRSASDWVWETDHNINLSYVSNRISEALETPPSALRKSVV